LKKHSVQTVDEYATSIASGGGPSEHQGCPEHNKPLEVFCATCMVLLCMTCAFLEHPKGVDHDVGDLSTMSTRMLKQLATAVVPVEQQQEKLAQAVVTVKAAKAGLAQNKKTADAAVEASAKAMRQAEVRYVARGKAAVKEVADTKNAVLDEQLLALKNAQERVAGGLQYHGYAVDPSRTPVHMLEATAALVPGLQLLAGLDHPMAPCVSANLIHAGNPAAVVSAIDALGAAVCHDTVAANCVVAGAGLEKVKVGEEAEFTVELRDGKNAALRDLLAECALAMVVVTAVARVAAADGAESGGGGRAGEGAAAAVAVAVSTTCVGGGALLTCKYTVPPPASEEGADVPDMAVEIVVQVLGQSVPRSPFSLKISPKVVLPPCQLKCYMCGKAGAVLCINEADPDRNDIHGKDGYTMACTTCVRYIGDRRYFARRA
jgi:hypothetical protein